MALSHEKLSIILMHDSGESKRIRVRRSRFRSLITFFVLCPFIAIAGFAGVYYLWEANQKLQVEIAHLQQNNDKYEITTKRLTHLEALLNKQSNVQERLVHNVATSKSKNEVAKAESNTKKTSADTKKDDKTKTETTAKTEATAKTEGPATTEAAASTEADPAKKDDVKAEDPKTEDTAKEKVQEDDDPGHADFPVLDTKEVIIQNVTSILSAKKRLRTSFDIRNGSDEGIAGEVFCILSLESGKTVRLVPKPAEAGKYKISRFKKAVMVTDIDPSWNMTNAQIILEVKNSEGKEIFRNIYAVSQ